jgi:hypothetical protein
LVDQLVGGGFDVAGAGGEQVDEFVGDAGDFVGQVPVAAPVA